MGKRIIFLQTAERILPHEVEVLRRAIAPVLREHDYIGIILGKGLELLDADSAIRQFRDLADYIEKQGG